MTDLEKKLKEKMERVILSEITEFESLTEITVDTISLTHAKNFNKDKPSLTVHVKINTIKDTPLK